MRRRKAESPSRQLRGKARKAYEDWEDRLEEISVGWGRRAETGGDPDNRRSAFLFREIYRLVNDLQESYGDRLEDAFLAKLGREPTISYHKMPYLWALKAANGSEGIKLSEDQVLRYGVALSYAKQHLVPPHFLWGFLHQVGGIRSIARKWREGQVEDWFATIDHDADPPSNA